MFIGFAIALKKLIIRQNESWKERRYDDGAHLLGIFRCHRSKCLLRILGFPLWTLIHDCSEFFFFKISLLNSNSTSQNFHLKSKSNWRWISRSFQSMVWSKLHLRAILQLFKMSTLKCESVWRPALRLHLHRRWSTLCGWTKCFKFNNFIHNSTMFPIGRILLTAPLCPCPFRRRSFGNSAGSRCFSRLKLLPKL